MKEEVSEFFKIFLDNLKEAIIFCNIKGKCLYINKAAEKITGYKINEIIGKNPKKLILKKFWPLCEKMKLVISVKGRSPEIEVEIKRKDGKIIPAEIYGKKIKYGLKLGGMLIFIRDISEKKKFLEKILESKKTNEEIIENAPFGIFIVNKKGEVEYVNSAMIKISGTSKDIFKGLNVLKLPTYLKAGIAKKIKEGLKGKSFSIGPIEYLSYYGKKKTVRKFIGIPLKIGGKIEKLMVFVEDLTKIKKMEEMIRESEKKFRNIVENARDGICIIQDKKVKFVNDALAKIIGYKKEEIIGENFLKFIPKELRKKIEENYEKRIRGEKLPSLYEAELLRKNGKKVSVEISASLLEYEGRPADFGIIRDITERKRLEEEIRNSEKKFRILFENAVDPILLLDRKGKILMANKKVEELTGYEREEIVGRHFARVGLLTPKSAIETLKNFFKRMMGLEVKPYEIEVMTKKGEIIYGELNASVIEDLGELVIIRNITEKKKLEEELRRSYEELKKLDVKKSEFISIASHEIKTPLAAIHGFVELLQSENVFINKKEREKYLEIIEKETKRLAKLVDDILDLSRIDLGTIKLEINKVNIYNIIRKIEREFEIDIKKKGLELILNLEKSLSEIKTDEEKLYRILFNLVNNAIKYTPKGKITIHAIRKGDLIQFCVEDTGIGIPREYQEKIFERFYQIESPYTRAHKGAGLGLSICKELVKLLGGNIWVESEVGKGSKFFFTLPIKS